MFLFYFMETCPCLWHGVHGHTLCLQSIVFLQAAKLQLQWAVVPQYKQEHAVTTDAWSAGKSTAGQRALRLAGAEDWAPVYTSAQTLVNSSSQALKKVLSSLKPVLKIFSNVSVVIYKAFNLVCHHTSDIRATKCFSLIKVRLLVAMTVPRLAGQNKTEHRAHVAWMCRVQQGVEYGSLYMQLFADAPSLSAGKVFKFNL